MENPLGLKPGDRVEVVPDYREPNHYGSEYGLRPGDTGVFQEFVEERQSQPYLIDFSNLPAGQLKKDNLNFYPGIWMQEDEIRPLQRSVYDFLWGLGL